MTDNWYRYTILHAFGNRVHRGLTIHYTNDVNGAVYTIRKPIGLHIPILFWILAENVQCYTI